MFKNEIPQIFFNDKTDTIIYFKTYNDTINGYNKNNTLIIQYVNGLKMFERDQTTLSYFDYEKNARLSKLREFNLSGQLISTFMFEYNENDLIISLTRFDNNNVAAYRQEYQYITR